jgi:hypothetical protein
MRMKKVYITIEDFNKMSEKELECFALVTHDGSDQYVITWSGIIDSVFDMKESMGKTFTLSDYTNVELLDIYYESSDLNGNNHEILVAQIVDGLPVISKLEGF